ncbi:FAS1-like dehydratase domain-containing protein [Vineibacter terrae]|uniref:FAS1-like dehydratase domain-containing protein n=1 Tax=Vineibacter terrae TaxID=2586908 RepID=UPI002E37AEF1|nr:MaoC family dehydratase N-terminal domain-containing protein [Vineibacter terrae]HEX2888372.1 MaoC family dehydratase N-terminal domain-containing protein [Vineibacter terrae]
MADAASDYRAWIGQRRTHEDVIAPFPPKALIATFDTGDPEPRIGDPLPPVWHWLYFLDTAPWSKLGRDGMPTRGDFLPPIPLPRLMWAGTQFTFHDAPLRIGDQITREQEVSSIEPKSGSTGQMVFVTQRLRIHGPAGLAITEERSSVFREDAKPGEKQKAPRQAPTDATWSKTIAPDPVLLFRFSALTFNPHRIHYDQPYVTSVEGYPGLLVHGPLMSLLQIELARRSTPGRKVATYSCRALAPVYANAAFSVQARAEADGSVTTWIADPNGGMAQQGKVTFA